MQIFLRIMVLLLLSSDVWAQNKSLDSITSGELPTGYIPIIGERPKIYDLNDVQQVQDFGLVYGQAEAAAAKEGKSKPIAVKSESSIISRASKAAVQAFIKGLRSDICGALEKGDSFKVALGFDAGGQIGVADIKGTGSLEVHISCAGSAG